MMAHMAYIMLVLRGKLIFLMQLMSSTDMGFGRLLEPFSFSETQEL